MKMKKNPLDLEPFRQIVGPLYVKEEPEVLTGHTIDGAAPKAVIFPGEVDEVSGVVHAAAEKGLSMVPRGSGSKMSAGHPPSRMDLVIGMERLNRIVDMDTANLTVTVQAGAPFREVQSILKIQEDRCYLPHEDPKQVADEAICSERENRGCFIPLMPPFSETATLGGIIAANSSGPNRLLYGLPRDLVLGVRYVAPDGGVVGMGGKTVKNVSGYDMSKLMIGSMGTLGILCEMTLRLLPLPEQEGTGIFLFEDLAGARQFVEWLLDTALLPAAVEMINAGALNLLAPEGLSASVAEAYAVVTAFEGVQEAVVRMKSETASRARALGANRQTYLERDAHTSFWGAYSNLASRLSSEYPGLLSVKLNYPISCYGDILEGIGTLASAADLDHAVLCHGGSGAARIHFLPDPGDGRDEKKLVTLVEEILERCYARGGNLVVERARPELKGALPVWGRQRDDQAVMQRIKEGMDPAGLFSPGRFVGGI